MSEFSFGIPLPPELLAEAQRQHDLHHMETQTVRHDMFAFLDSLDEGQTDQMLRLVRSFSREEDGTYAKYISGYLSGLRERKFNICPGCNVNHDEVPEDMRPKEEESINPFDVTLHTKPGTPERSAELDKITARQEEAVETARIGTPYVLTEFDHERMNEYNLDDLRDEDDRSTLLGFVCLGCGMRYVSIEDRMRRPPGIAGCAGCQHKSAHG